MSFDADSEPLPAVEDLARDWSNTWALVRTELPELSRHDQLERALVFYFDGVRSRYGMSKAVAAASVQAVYASRTHVPATMRIAIDALFSNPADSRLRKSRVWKTWFAGTLIWMALAFVLFMILSEGGSDEGARWLAAAIGLPAVAALAIAMTKWARK